MRTSFSRTNDAPEWTDKEIAHADAYHGETLVRRDVGRPKVEFPKNQVTVRLVSDVSERLRATGLGWQGRLNQALREWLDRQG